MFLTASGLTLVVFIFYGGIKFYRQMDWQERAEPSPDLRGMHKKTAELLRVEEVLTIAREQGKLSQGCLDEVIRYCESEIVDMKTVEAAWKNRRGAPKETSL